MGRDQELKWLAFSLYPLSFFLYSPFNLYKSKNWTTREKLKRRWEIIWNKWLCLRVRNKAHTKYIQTDNQLSQAELSRPTVVPTWHDIFLRKVFDCHITSTFCMQYFLSLFRFQRILKYPWIQMCAYWSCTPFNTMEPVVENIANSFKDLYSLLTLTRQHKVPASVLLNITI